MHLVIIVVSGGLSSKHQLSKIIVVIKLLPEADQLLTSLSQRNSLSERELPAHVVSMEGAVFVVALPVFRSTLKRRDGKRSPMTIGVSDLLNSTTS